MDEGFIQRIRSIMAHFDLNAASLSDRLGVQRSNISHILSERNKPSLDFVLKLIHAFPALSIKWVLFGKGTMLDQEQDTSKPDRSATLKKDNNKDSIDRIVIFYSDGSFENFQN